MILYFAIIVNLLLAFKLWWDYRAKNKKHRIINHGLSAAIDGLIYTVSAWFLFGFDAGGWILLAIGYRWIMFDFLFNKLNDDDWDHYGLSSKLDRFMRVLGKWHLVPKILTIVLAVALILIF